MNEYEIPIGSLEEQALRRKERLKNLKRKAAAKESKSTDASSDNQKQNLPLPPKLAKNDQTEETVENVENTESDNIELKNDDVISKITSEVDSLKTPIVIDQIDIQNLAPRKPDLDLKRDVEKKLDILKRRTQRAIAELIRERLRSNQGDVDLQAVNTVGYSAIPAND